MSHHDDTAPARGMLARLRSRRTLAAIGLLAVGLYLAATVVRIVVRKHYVFLASYIRWTLTPAPTVDGPTHLFVIFTDHFEPNRSLDTVNRWMSRWVPMTARHRDSTGRRPQHTWFYPAEQYEPAIMERLREAAVSGLGEVEFHFHHDYDTAESLRATLSLGLQRFAQFGFNRTTDGRRRFAFVHGNFGLDNSNGPFFCGVNEELSLLRDLGGFADFTFPSVYMDSQPPFVNTIYAARDTGEPRSYSRALPLNALGSGEADLMIFQGPLVYAPSTHVRRLFLDLDDGDVHPAMPASPARVDRWVRANVHVPSRPDWVFIKLFAHSAASDEEMASVTGPEYDRTLSYLESRYNDGRRYVLHYITAREAYNLAMAAADGLQGNPASYVDYRVAPYVASARGQAGSPHQDQNLESRSGHGPERAERAAHRLQ